MLYLKKKYIKSKIILFIMANCSILEKYYIKYSSNSRENIGETLHATLFNSCVQSLLLFFVIHINGAF